MAKQQKNTFSPGKPLVCIKEGDWKDQQGDVCEYPAPTKDEVVTVDYLKSNGQFVTLKEYNFKLYFDRIGFNIKWFRPFLEVHSEYTEQIITDIEKSLQTANDLSF